MQSWSINILSIQYLQGNRSDWIGVLMWSYFFFTYTFCCIHLYLCVQTWLPMIINNTDEGDLFDVFDDYIIHMKLTTKLCEGKVSKLSSIWRLELAGDVNIPIMHLQETCILINSLLIASQVHSVRIHMLWRSNTTIFITSNVRGINVYMWRSPTRYSKRLSWMALALRIT